jgi:predicted nucleic acid-binding protein
MPGIRRIDFNLHRFLEVRAPGDSKEVAALQERIGRGEAEAIVLALETRADALLIDEAKGRAIAEARGIRPLGALGLLVQAKRAGHVSNVAPLIDRLEKELAFRVSDRLRRRILDAAGE